MVDVIEIPAPAVDVLGNLTVVWVAGAVPATITAAAVKAGKRVTYSFIPGGWAPDQTQDIVKDPRKSLPQDLESLGKINASLKMQYVDSADPNSAAVLLTAYSPGWFFERRSVSNPTDFAAAQTGRVIAGTLGIQSPLNGDDGKFGIEQSMALGSVIRTVTLT
ncbi:hypothetical protein [Subtercola sp. RTI3]|uniref:phage tail tube protein n=1 Tax=Subtercola sp. RTI3 TaxID=3048639 RepID=UPI002B224D8D|nr:hypothetical protein [Subtercola sp. RTI3]MEA9983648.1 hypothetical protein [Subtercola sp. RTI3]